MTLDIPKFTKEYYNIIHTHIKQNWVESLDSLTRQNKLILSLGKLQIDHFDLDFLGHMVMPIFVLCDDFPKLCDGIRLEMDFGLHCIQEIDFDQA